MRRLMFWRWASVWLAVGLFLPAQAGHGEERVRDHIYLGSRLLAITEDAATPAPNLPPFAFAVAPTSGAGTSGTFSFTVSDADGFADISWMTLLFNSTLNAVNGCYVHY